MPTDAPVASILGTEAFGTDWVSRSTTAVSTHRPGASGQVAPSAQVHGTTARCASYGWNAGYKAGYPEEEYRHAAVVPGSSIDLEDHRQDPVRYTALCRCPTALHAGLAIATPRSPGHPLTKESCRWRQRHTALQSQIGFSEGLDGGCKILAIDT